MTISSAPPKDVPAAALQAQITAITATIAGLPASSAVAVVQTAALNQAQIALVLHYLETGRINAATILSTLT